MSIVTRATNSFFINIIRIISIILTHVGIIFRAKQISIIEWYWAESHVNEKRYWIYRGFIQCCVNVLWKISIWCIISGLRFLLRFTFNLPRFSLNSPFLSQINFHAKKKNHRYFFPPLYNLSSAFYKTVLRTRYAELLFELHHIDKDTEF